MRRARVGWGGWRGLVGWAAKAGTQDYVGGAASCHRSVCKLDRDGATGELRQPGGEHRQRDPARLCAARVADEAKAAVRAAGVARQAHRRDAVQRQRAQVPEVPLVQPRRQRPQVQLRAAIAATDSLAKGFLPPRPGSPNTVLNCH